MESKLDLTKVKRFIEAGWIEGWGLSYYQNSRGKSELGQLVYDTKYDFYGKTVEQREQTAEKLRTFVKDFIHITYPPEERPFNAVITPPSNLVKPFELTKYIASRLTAGGMQDLSSFVSKTRDIPMIKKLPASERKKALDGAFEMIGLQHAYQVKGILILDDILDTGATAHEMCNMLEKRFPGVPRYYLALTYLGDGR